VWREIKGATAHQILQGATAHILHCILCSKGATAHLYCSCCCFRVGVSVSLLWLESRWFHGCHSSGALSMCWWQRCVLNTLAVVVAVDQGGFVKACAGACCCSRALHHVKVQRCRCVLLLTWLGLLAAGLQQCWSLSASVMLQGAVSCATVHAMRLHECCGSGFLFTGMMMSSLQQLPGSTLHFKCSRFVCVAAIW
jgi:hypothetical protein